MASHETRPPVGGESRTIRVEGAEIGSEASFFLVDTDPGRGSLLHKHPYAETWIVRSGQVAFTVGDETVLAAAGDIVVGPAETPHRFENIGDGPLKMVCIHPRPTIEQTNIAPA
ncbi:cupin domain-containing protein [Rhizobium halophytocola]|uniref:Mannose-6-phosphate isomerase-like protein (Cupin superfamily) n=2 Tax=Rhizobium halophytocola TaxID=735519 RepID=A0ABS4E3M4_9HYPH|nr:mannose-6-phosphate isomerase-like protein (cupin superfamily) [Rhizobium halophytocola]